MSIHAPRWWWRLRASDRYDWVMPLTVILVIIGVLVTLVILLILGVSGGGSEYDRFVKRCESRPNHFVVAKDNADEVICVRGTE